MSMRRYLQLDVFAQRPGAGNPPGVVLHGEVWVGGAVQRVPDGHGHREESDA